MSQKIVIVGAGAAGVFTAYRIREMYGAEFEIVLLERENRVGGNTYTQEVEYGGQSYAIDCGAQFFFKNPQAGYTQLVEDLGLFDEELVTSKAAGFTIWDKQADERVFFVPDRLGGFGKYGLDDWERIIEFGIFLGYAFALDRDPSPDYTLSVDKWLDGLGLLTNDFKQKVVKSFLYQFVTLPGERIGESSALYAVTYFVRNVFGEARVDEPDPTTPRIRGLPVFKTYQSKIGLDGILKRALAAVGVTPTLNADVLLVQKNPGGARPWLVTTSQGQLDADYVVLACDPQRAATALSAGATVEASLIADLQAIEYSKLRISMQKDGTCHMPSNSKFWQPVNTIVDGDRLTFSAWFGPLRAPYEGKKKIPVFKSWASPGLDPATCPHEFLADGHYIIQPTTPSMAARERVMARSTQDGLFFAGGWTNWFDSQEAALDSATEVAEALPPVARPETGRRRMVPADSDLMRKNLQNWLDEVSTQAPSPQHKKRITDAFRKVETEG